MKLLFRGWGREVKEHNHEVIPVAYLNNAYHPGETGDPLSWHSALNALGKVDGLVLSGSFLLKFSFEQEELRNWLRKFVQSKPEAAIRLLAEMQGEAILALAKQTEARAIENSSSGASASGETSTTAHRASE